MADPLNGPAPRAADSFSRLEHVVLGPFRRGLAWLLRPMVLLLSRARVRPLAVSLSQIPLGFAAAALIVPAPRVALALFLAALLLDAIDGALARETGAACPLSARWPIRWRDHLRELTVVGGLVAAGALRGRDRRGLRGALSAL